MAAFDFSQVLTVKRYPLIEKLLVWVAPCFVIPSLRFFQDPPETRKTLFVRDFTTYSMGAGIFFLSGGLAKACLEHPKVMLSPMLKQLGALTVALGANFLYAGVGAIKLSQWLTAKESKAPKVLPCQKPLSNMPLPPIHILPPPERLGFRPTSLIHFNCISPYVMYYPR